MKPGEIVGKENEEGIVIIILSTRYNIDVIDMRKMNKNKEHVIIKPKIIIHYNLGKTGIYLSDRLSSSNTFVRRSIRRYHKVATELLLGTFVVYALIIYV